MSTYSFTTAHTPGVVDDKIDPLLVNNKLLRKIIPVVPVGSIIRATTTLLQHYVTLFRAAFFSLAQVNLPHWLQHLQFSQISFTPVDSTQARAYLMILSGGLCSVTMDYPSPIMSILMEF
jgi:hypothetical protein